MKEFSSSYFALVFYIGVVVISLYTVTTIVLSPEPKPILKQGIVEMHYTGDNN